jgi:hypothetical protein
MTSDDSTEPTIRPEDVVARTIHRRTFLGRFGAAAGFVGLAALTGCGNESDTADTDGDPADADPTDPADQDGDSSDSD